MTRAEGAVVSQPLDRGGCVLLDGCAAGLPLGSAAEQAVQVQPGVDLAAVVNQLLAAGAFKA